LHVVNLNRVDFASAAMCPVSVGGICISRGVHDHVRRKLPYGFEDLGEQSVKNITQPICVFRLIADATKTESPSGREICAAASLPCCATRHAEADTTADLHLHRKFIASCAAM
jgi:hypothetical protein